MRRYIENHMSGKDVRDILNQNFEDLENDLNANFADLKKYVDNLMGNVSGAGSFAELTGKASFEQLPALWWANVAVSAAPKTDAVPTFAALKIGGATVRWDAEHDGLYIDKGVRSDSYMTGYGVNGSGGGSIVGSTVSYSQVFEGDGEKIGVITIDGVPTDIFAPKGGGTPVDLSGYVLKTELAKVATSGSYADLTNKPTIPTKVSELTNDSKYLTSVAYDDLSVKPTKAQIKAILGISDWALAAAKPAYAFSEITGSVAFAQLPELWWANVKLSSSSSDTTEPTFKTITLKNGRATVTLACDANGDLHVNAGVWSDSFMTGYGPNGNGGGSIAGSTVSYSQVFEGDGEKIGVITIDGVPTNIYAPKGGGTPVDLSAYAQKTEIPVVPTNISAFTNDSKYLTSVAYNDLTTKPTKAQIKTILGISDWALATAKPAYSWSDITGKPNRAGSSSDGGPADYVRWESASANAARRVPFAYDSTTETTNVKVRLVYNDKFKYNPSTDVLTVGSISGTAAGITGYTIKELSASGVTHTGWSRVLETDNKIIPTMSFMAYWNGAYNSSNSSNLKYCTNGEIIGSNNIGSQSVNYATSAGSATTASKLTGNTYTIWGQTYLSAGVPQNVNGSLLASVSNTNDIYAAVQNSNGSVSIQTSTNRGLYDRTSGHTGWVVGTNNDYTFLMGSKKVGINTLTPAHWLDVNGSIRTSGSLYLSTDSSEPRIWYDTTNKCIHTNVGIVSDSFVMAYGANSQVTFGNGLTVKNGHLMLDGYTATSASSTTKILMRTSSGNPVLGLSASYSNNNEAWLVLAHDWDDSDEDHAVIGVNGAYSCLTGKLRVGSTGSGSYMFEVFGSSNFSNNIYLKGSLIHSSDIQLKNIYDDVVVDIADVADAPCFEYAYKDDESGLRHIGSSAQYWREKLPLSVMEDAEGWLALDYSGLTFAAAVELSKKTLDHESRILALEKENAELKGRIAELEK